VYLALHRRLIHQDCLARAVKAEIVGGVALSQEGLEEMHAVRYRALHFRDHSHSAVEVYSLGRPRSMWMMSVFREQRSWAN